MSAQDLQRHASGFACFLLLAAQAASGQEAPSYQVDPFWPKQLPNKWSMQQIVDISIGPDDHIWVLNRRDDARPDETGADRTPPRQECCRLGPEVLEFDPEGNVVRAWGGPGYHAAWPIRLQTLTVDGQSNVWISGARPGDSIVKFSGDGEFLWDFGHRGPRIDRNVVTQNNQRTDMLVAGIGAFDFDEDAREIYIADGFINKRILVYDMDTAEFKRGWGGKGQPLAAVDNDPTPPYDVSGPPPDQEDFAPTIHCVHISHDKLVYACERGSNRIQVFTTSGEFVESLWVHPSTQARGPGCGGIWSTTDPPCGTVYNLAFSADPEQRFIFVADGTNNIVWILERDSGETVGSFGGNGRYAGQLHWIDSIAVDSKGNVYTGEVEDGKRIQKFVPAN
jgi:hypothetical protein